MGQPFPFPVQLFPLPGQRFPPQSGASWPPSPPPQGNFSHPRWVPGPPCQILWHAGFAAKPPTQIKNYTHVVCGSSARASLTPTAQACAHTSYPIRFKCLGSRAPRTSAWGILNSTLDLARALALARAPAKVLVSSLRPKPWRGTGVKNTPGMCLNSHSVIPPSFRFLSGMILPHHPPSDNQSRSVQKKFCSSTRCTKAQLFVS